MPSHQRFFRFDQTVRPASTVCLVACALQSLLPKMVYVGTLLGHMGCSRQRQLQRRRCQHRQHLRADKGIQAGSHELLACLAPVLTELAGTAVRVVRGVPIGHAQPAAAKPTDQQPAQQCGSVTRYSQLVGLGLIGGQPRLILLELLPADVGRQAVVQQHGPGAPTDHHPAAIWVPCSLAARVYRSAAIHVRSRVIGMLEDV